MTASSQFSFAVTARDGAARTGIIQTPRGEIRTPAFMPVGTAGTVKAMLPGTVRELGADIVLGHPYHLVLRPGAERGARRGVFGPENQKGGETPRVFSFRGEKTCPAESGSAIRVRPSAIVPFTKRYVRVSRVGSLRISESRRRKL